MAEQAATCTPPDKSPHCHFNIAIHSHCKVPELRFLLRHNAHLSPTTGKFLKLEKEEEREREKRRKMAPPINPMSETLSRVKTVRVAQYENDKHDLSASSLLQLCCYSWQTLQCKGCSVPQARVKLASGQKARVKSSQARVDCASQPGKCSD